MRVVVAENNPAGDLLADMLTDWGYTPLIVTDCKAAIEAMEGPGGAKLLLLDAEITGMDGLDICRRLHEVENSDPPYIIIITGKQSHVNIVRALDAGASDCIKKPFDQEELRARVHAGRRTLQLQAELNETKSIMTRLAMYDSLTEVYNRRAILERLEQERARARRSNTFLHVGLADLDYFKTINDTHGHQFGDEAIRAFTRGVQTVMRASDNLGRWGGEEFLILAPEAPPSGPSSLFERICRQIESLAIPTLTANIQITASIGVAIGTGHESADELLHRADEALYRAKANGRNQVCYESAGNETRRQQEGDAAHLPVR